MKSKWILATAFAAALSITVAAPAQTPAGKMADTSKTAKKTAEATAAPTDAQIADAKSKGMVWVNTESKVYHKDGKYYGNTKHGQFMTEADAQKAGYKAAKR